MNRSAIILHLSLIACMISCSTKLYCADKPYIYYTDGDYADEDEDDQPRKKTRKRKKKDFDADYCPSPNNEQNDDYPGYSRSKKREKTHKPKQVAPTKPHTTSKAPTQAPQHPKGPSLAESSLRCGLQNCGQEIQFLDLSEHLRTVHPQLLEFTAHHKPPHAEPIPQTQPAQPIINAPPQPSGSPTQHPLQVARSIIQRQMQQIPAINQRLHGATAQELNARQHNTRTTLYRMQAT